MEGREGRREGGEEWGSGGVRHGLRPPRDKLWIRPCDMTRPDDAD